MNKLAKLIEELGEEDLHKVKRDLIAGNIDRLIEIKLMQGQNQKFLEKTCPICGGFIEEESLILEFGSSSLRRKAHFDGTDCLEYFLNTKIKKTTQNE